MPLLLLLILPALEIYLFIKIGAEIGALAVIVWLVGAVVLGMNILRFLGASSLLNAARKMQTGEAPATALIDALVKAVAAVFLVIPGFATDFMAVLLLIAPLRRVLLKRWLSKFALKASFGSTSFGGRGFGSADFDGNVYEHKGSARPSEGQLSDRILEHESDKKNP
jgi:UPF0716 protein FxsA